MDLAKDFADNGYFFKLNFDPLNKVTDNFYDYFVVLTEKEYALFHVAGTLSPSLEYRAGVLNLQCGAGSLKHAFLMYVFNSHSGRNAQTHYVVHVRLNLEFVSQPMASGLLTIWNRHYADYSLVIKNDINFNTANQPGGLYQFATITFIRDFMDYKQIRESRDYVSDGSLYFDFHFDIPEVILEIFCTDVNYAPARVDL